MRKLVFIMLLISCSSAEPDYLGIIQHAIKHIEKENPIPVDYYYPDSLLRVFKVDSLDMSELTYRTRTVDVISERTELPYLEILEFDLTDSDLNLLLFFSVDEDYFKFKFTKSREGWEIVEYYSFNL